MKNLMNNELVDKSEIQLTFMNIGISKILNNLCMEFTRKPSVLAEVKTRYFWPLANENQSFLRQILYIIPLIDVTFDHEFTFFDKQDFEGHQFAVIKNNKKYYLVDNQGYNYCRYVVELADINKIIWQ